LIRRAPEGSALRKTCARIETLASGTVASAQRRRTISAPGQIQSEREFGERKCKELKERNFAFISFQ
jgi:hypothetical protein